jgi:uncharacterized protein
MIVNLEPCIPPRWAKDGHRQTITGYLLPSPKVTFKGEEFLIPLEDGDQLTGTLHRGPSPFVILLFHGLNGSEDSNYMNRTTLLAREMGHSVVLVNHRGCGRGRGLARKPYHSGRGEDLSAAVAFVRELLPAKKQIAIGFSLSANALLLLLAGVRGVHKPDFAMAINGPVDLRACSDELKKGFNRFYDYRFVQDIKKDIYYKQRTGLIDTHHKIHRSYYLEDLDMIYTAPQGGFKSADHYYEVCSAAPHFHKIETPTFILSAKDDPFILWQPYLKASENPHIQLHLENSGGHLGYLSTNLPGKWGRFGFQRWMDYAIKKVITAFTS